MPFHPNGLDHETLKKLAKNLKKGFPKVFPDTPCTTAQSQNLLALEMGYEHWHEAIAVRDPSLLATSTDVDAPPSLDELLDPLRAALPQGALLITGGDSALNAELFKVLRQHGQEDLVTVFNPTGPTATVASRNVRVAITLASPDEIAETHRLFSPPDDASTARAPSPTDRPVASGPKDLPDHPAPLAHDCLTLLETLLASLESTASLPAAIERLASLMDLDHQGSLPLGAYVRQHWLPLAPEAQHHPNRLVRRMAGLLNTVSRPAAQALVASIRPLTLPPSSVNGITWFEAIDVAADHLARSTGQSRRFPRHDNDNPGTSLQDAMSGFLDPQDGPVAAAEASPPDDSGMEDLLQQFRDVHARTAAGAPSRRRGRNLGIDALMFEGLTEYLALSFAGVDALQALANDLTVLDLPGQAHQVRERWLPHFRNGQVAAWATEVAHDLKDHAPRAAYALLRASHMANAGQLESGLRQVATLLREAADAQARRAASAPPSPVHLARRQVGGASQAASRVRRTEQPAP